MTNIMKLERFKIKKLSSIKNLYLGIGLFCTFATIFRITFSVAESGDGSLVEGIIYGIDGFRSAITDSGMAMLFMPILAGIYLASDFDHKTINNQIVTGHTRASIILSKFSGFTLASVFTLFFYPLISFVVLSFFNGLGLVGVSFFSLILYILRTLILMFIVNMAFGSFSFFFAFLFRTTAATITISMLFFILGQIVVQMLGLWFPKIIETLVKLSPFDKLSMVVQESLSVGDLLSILLTSFATMAVMIGLSYLVFRKKDLK